MEDQASSLQLDLIVPVTDVKRTESNRDEKEKCAAVASKSPEKSQLESPALGKTSENVGSSQHDPIGSSEESTPSSVQIDTETKSNDATQECKGLPDAESNVDSKSHAAALLDSGSKAEAMPEPVPVERIFSIEVFYEDSELKSLTVESSDKNSANQSSADMSSSEQTKHTANGVAELCNFMITHFSAMLEETITTMSGGRSPRGKMGRPSPEPGFSGDIDVKKSGRRSNKRSPPPQIRLFESSDSSDLSQHEELPRLNSDTALEEICGVQPELQSTPKDCEIFKRNLIAEYLENDPTRSLDVYLGPMPTKNDLFKGCHFILTCTIPMKAARMTETNGSQFGTTPFFKDHLSAQIEMGGGTVYRFFEEIPKGKHRKCKIIAHSPCTTARYVQSIAAKITPVSHEWIVDCCTQNQLLEYDKYVLPSGWSLVENRYINRRMSRSKKALRKVSILMAFQMDDVYTFWQRVCKLAGAEMSIVHCLGDIDEKSKGIMVTDEDFPSEIKAKAEHYRIPVVSTVWVVQSLIAGYAIDAESNPKLKMAYEDEDF